MARNAPEDQTASGTLRDHANPVAKKSSLATDRTASSRTSSQQRSGRHSHKPIVQAFECGRLMQGDTLASVSEPTASEELASLFLFLADNDFAGYCLIYEQLARSIAADAQLLEFVLTSASPNTRRGRIPVLFFAATHDRVLANPTSEIAAIYRGESDAEPFHAFLQLIDNDRDEIAAIMRTRSVQTNEVGRSSVLTLAFNRALGDVQVSSELFEIGPSAGLNLFYDRFHIDFTRDADVVASSGPDDASVRLTCEVRGPLTPLFPVVPFTPTERAGLDPNPIDVRSDAECRWLQACVWPGIPDRPQRLAAALEVARTDPPRLIAGDAVTDLAPALSTASLDSHLIVFATWALAYVSAEGRIAVLDTIDQLGAARDLDFITFEEPRFTPWVDAADAELFERYLGEGTPTQLSLRSWRNGMCTTTALAIAHPHGRWIHWLEENHG